MMAYRNAPRGGPSAGLPPTAFVSFIQNHDQIGNRAFGERLNALAPPEAIRALASVYLLAPQIPMLFMGEEWGAAQPFPLLLRFQGRAGGRRPQGTARGILAFPGVCRSRTRRRRFPTHRRRRRSLRQSSTGAASIAEHLAYYRALLETRREYVRPLLPSIQRGARRSFSASKRCASRWRAGDRRLVLDANLSARPVASPPLASRVFWRCGDADAGLGPWSVRWGIEPA